MSGGIKSGANNLSSMARFRLFNSSVKRRTMALFFSDDIEHRHPFIINPNYLFLVFGSCCENKARYDWRALEFQSLRHSFAKLRVSLGEVFDHASLNRLVCFPERINDVVNQVVLIHFAE